MTEPPLTGPEEAHADCIAASYTIARALECNLTPTTRDGLASDLARLSLAVASLEIGAPEDH